MESIIIAIAGSSALAALISGIFTTVNNRATNKRADNSALFKRLEVDIVRTQLLVLLSDYPENVSEIMKVSEHYFSDLEGDWYMTSLFNTWLTKNKIAKPEWFNSEH